MRCTTGILEVGRARARDDGLVADVPPSYGVRAGDQRREERQSADLSLPARRRRRAQRGGAARRARVLRDCARPSRFRGPLRGANAAIDLDGFFGLHPSLAPLKPLWDQRHAAPIHAVGARARRARISMRRTTWRAARPTTRDDAMAGSTGISRSGHVRGVQLQDTTRAAPGVAFAPSRLRRRLHAFSRVRPPRSP